MCHSRIFNFSCNYQPLSPLHPLLGWVFSGYLGNLGGVGELPGLRLNRPVHDRCSNFFLGILANIHPILCYVWHFYLILFFSTLSFLFSFFFFSSFYLKNSFTNNPNKILDNIIL